jgi:hypothetical protein
MYMKQNHPYNPVLCDECGCEKRVLLSLTAFDLCLGCLEEANKTVAAWKQERRDYVLAYPHLMNAKVLDEEPHQVIEPHETSSC